jgi:hypothetical protein
LRELPQSVQIGVRLRDVHATRADSCMAASSRALADNAMGLSFVRVFKATVEDPANPAKGSVTVGLSPWTMSRPQSWDSGCRSSRVVKAGRSLGFVAALITADGDIVARGNATFRLTS